MVLLAILIIAPTLSHPVNETPPHSKTEAFEIKFQTTVFREKSDGYMTVRIPALVSR